VESEDLPYEARIDLCPSSDSEKRLILSMYRSLVAEAKSPASLGRIRIRVELKGECLSIDMRTDTESHLRAVLNSMMYLLHAVREVVHRVESEQPS